jgi:hypothetical protein
VNKRSAVLLQAAVVLIGLGALAFMLGEPHVEGRNVHATLFEIYFKDPFLAYAYLASVPFFVALHRSFTLLGDARRGTPFSRAAVKGLRTIKHCGMAMLVFAAGGIVFIMLSVSDDRAGGVFMGVLASLISLLIAAGGAVLEKKALASGDGSRAS